MVESRRINGQPDEHPDLEVLLLRLDRELYAVPSASVREVARYRAFTPVPGAPPALPGIISQRGMILPIVEPHPLLGFAQFESTRSARLVVIIHNEIGMALVADEVLDLIALSSSTLEPVPTVLDPARARFLRGVIHDNGRPVGLIDLDELIAGLREKA